MRERNAVRLASGEGRRLWVLGHVVTYKVTADRTGGAYSLFEVSTPPGCGPPPHIQHREDECFFVLEGEYEFCVGDETMRAGTGCMIFVPRGAAHAFENVGPGVGRLLMSQTPGGSHERFFEEVGEEVPQGESRPATGGPAHSLQLARIAARYGIEMLPQHTA